MAITLPTEPLPATRTNPKILLLYGMPKVGKTEELTKLPNNLILDLEDGSAYFPCLRVNITKTGELDEVFDDIMEKGKERAKAGKKGDDIFPYKYISIDTVDLLEEMAERSATVKYKNSIIGNTFKGDTVLDLPKGAGYGHIRKEVMEKIIKLSKVCKALIITSHVKEKLLDKGGVEVSSTDISLAGKLAGIVCSKADAIGYMYRDPDGVLCVNFVTLQETSVMGGRAQHLKGQDFPFDWSKIFIAEE